MLKNCKTCAFENGDRCDVMKEKIVDCFAWADYTEKKKRENAITKYEYSVDRTEKINKKINEARILNAKKRGGATVQETLKEKFMFLYLKNYDDTEIGNMISVSESSVRSYRNKLKLEPNGNWKKGLKNNAV